MRHYHNWSIWQQYSITWNPLPPMPFPMPNGFDPMWICDLPCDNALTWTDNKGHWQGDKYNPDGMCCFAINREIK